MRAVIYIRLSKGQETWTDYELYKVRTLEYCREKGYDILLLIGLRGSIEEMEQYGQEKLFQLAEKELVDIIVVPNWQMLSDSKGEACNLSKKVEFFGVAVDSMDFKLPKKRSLFPFMPRTDMANSGMI